MFGGLRKANFWICTNKLPFPLNAFFDGKKDVLRLKNGLVFKLMPQLAAFYLGPTPVSLLLQNLCKTTFYIFHDSVNH